MDSSILAALRGYIRQGVAIKFTTASGATIAVQTSGTTTEDTERILSFISEDFSGIETGVDGWGYKPLQV